MLVDPERKQLGWYETRTLSRTSVFWTPKRVMAVASVRQSHRLLCTFLVSALASPRPSFEIPQEELSKPTRVPPSSKNSQDGFGHGRKLI
jgi:hypothetical protein